MPLLQSASPAVNFETGSVPAADFHCHLKSLPHRIGGDAPPKIPYLKHDEERAARWARVLGSHGFKIGIAWSSLPEARVNRSFPLRELEALGRLPGVRLISLQKHDGIEQLSELPNVEVCHGLDEGAAAFLDTAAVMATLDLIVSCDTSVANLAGAWGGRPGSPSITSPIRAGRPRPPSACPIRRRGRFAKRCPATGARCFPPWRRSCPTSSRVVGATLERRRDFHGRRSCRSQRQSVVSACGVEHRVSGDVDALPFQATLIVMGVATFSFAFASFYYYGASLGGRIDDAERARYSRRGDCVWLLGCVLLFLAPSLILFTVRLLAVPSVWFALWLVYVLFVIRHFPRVQTARKS